MSTRPNPRGWCPSKRVRLIAATLAGELPVGIEGWLGLFPPDKISQETFKAAAGDFFPRRCAPVPVGGSAEVHPDSAPATIRWDQISPPPPALDGIVLLSENIRKVSSGCGNPDGPN